MRIVLALCNRCGEQLNGEPPHIIIFDEITFELCDHCHGDVTDVLKPVAKARRTERRLKKEQKRKARDLMISRGWARKGRHG